MGKKKDAAKAAKKRAKLEAREAEIAAELERRAAEAKAAKKKGKKKSKGKKAKRIATLDGGGGASSGMVGAALGEITIEAEAPIATEPEPDPFAIGTVINTADGGQATIVDERPKKGKGKKSKRDETIDPETGETRPEVIAERKAAADAEREKMDAEIKARVQAKKAEREGSKADRRAALEATAADVDRSDHDAVMAYNAEAVKVGAMMLTSDQERAKIAARHEAEVVETEHGREFAVGESVAAPEFAKPSDAAPILEEGRNGYKIIQLDADGKPDPKRVRQVTRVTTFVNNIDDETTLKEWDKRILAEGFAADLAEPEAGDPLVVQVSTIVHRRDTKIAKAERADRKGKLGIGEVGDLIAAAQKEAKDDLNRIVEEAGEKAGRYAKARGGQHLHTLAEISDADGIDRVRQMHEDGETVHNDESGEDVPVTATDLASIEAYDERMKRLGAKVVHSEAVIVNDAMSYAGRLDRIIMCKLPELVVGRGTAGEYVRPADQRAKRYVTDIKSGRVDLGGGKIGRQLAAYALGDLYDLETGKRSRHSAARDVALVFHLPQGKGTCSVHVVDLKAGAALLKLSAEVRRARNTGRKVLDTSVDITDPAPETEA